MMDFIGMDAPLRLSGKRLSADNQHPALIEHDRRFPAAGVKARRCAACQIGCHLSADNGCVSGGVAVCAI